ncbi:MAG: DUF5666 domain-containing protein [Brevefilum sp.]|nr:DUF5666 domain-containing protein [Brevefilum sp.]
MKDYKYQNNHADLELEALLVELRQVPQRDPEKAEKSKARFLSEIDNINKEERISAQENQTNIVRQIKEYFKMATPKMKKVYQTAAIAIVVVAFLFGGAGITAAAASNSLPGDRLYAVKSGIEKARVQLATETEDKVQLNLQYAQMRLEEIESLIAQGRFNDIGKAVNSYEQYIQRALSELGKLSQSDPERAQILFSQIASSLKSFAMAFENVSGSSQSNQLPSFDDVIRFSESAGAYSGEIEFKGYVENVSGNIWTISGYQIIVTSATEIKGQISADNFVKVEAWVDDQGTIFAKEIELETDDEMSYKGEYEVKGIVSEVGDGYFMINGMRFELTPNSEIEDDIEVGDFVKVEGGMLGNGVFYIVEIEIEDDYDDMYDEDDDDMYDEDDDDMYDDDDDDMYDDDDDDMYDDDDDMGDDDDDMGDDDDYDDIGGDDDDDD